MSSLNPIDWFEARLIITIFIEITIKVGFDTPFGFVEVWSLGERFSEVLFDKKIEGFGEIFRYLSFKKIKTSTIQSRAVAGVANSTYIFCLPGSPSACKDAWVDIIQYQLDSTNKPCNLVELMPRLKD